MKQNKLIWILTASESLAANLEEILEADGYSCIISKDILQVKSSFGERSPQAFVLDELNNKGCYDELSKILVAVTRIIVLCGDCEKTAYPLAQSCLQLPENIDRISEILSNRY